MQHLLGGGLCCTFGNDQMQHLLGGCLCCVKFRGVNVVLLVIAECNICLGVGYVVLFSNSQMQHLLGGCLCCVCVV